MLGIQSISLSCQILEKPTSGKGQFSVRALGQFQSIFSDPGQTVEPLDSVGVDLDCPRPDLSVCEVRNQKNSKP